jgi:two-component system, OmpR family, response regulator
MHGPTDDPRDDATEGTIRVLLVEDDARLARLTAQYLEIRGLLVTVANTGPNGLMELKRGTFDVVLLDLLLPGKNGLEVCRDIRRRSDVPIIMITALGDEADRVVGLEAGADDYVCKPFSSPELLARIRANIRRSRGLLGPSDRAIEAGRLIVHPGTFTATLDGRPLELTTVEFAILRVLSERMGRPVSRDQLLELAKGDAGDAFDRSIDGHVSRLRRKLGDDPRRPEMIKTVRGIGYLFAGPEQP